MKPVVNCIGNPIYDPVNVIIDGDAYVTANCQGTPAVPDFIFCNVGSTIPVSAISGYFPAGSRFYSEYPLVEPYTEYTTSNPFPATSGTTTYWAIPPGITDCYYVFTITVSLVNSTPTPNNVEYCVGDVAVPLTATPSDPSYDLFYYYQSSGGSTFLSITPITSTQGTFTYYVAEGYDASCVGLRVPITVTVYASVVVIKQRIPIQRCVVMPIRLPSTLHIQHGLANSASVGVKIRQVHMVPLLLLHHGV